MALLMKVEAFPAYAGMNRIMKRLALTSTRVPRVCGDEPPADPTTGTEAPRSPRMRG